MIDADGAVITQAPTVPALDMNAATAGTCSGVGCTARRIGSTAEIYGRLQLGNAYGSELLAMPVPLEAQFWNPGGFWATNRDDRCTSITPSTIALSGFTQNLSACETQFLPNTAVTLVGGKAPLRFSASGAGNNGTVSLSLNIGAAAVGTTCLATGAATATTAANMPWFGTTNPAGRATFGVYKTPLIYRRENY
jgi:MSHA biogenesis protein MshQ